MFMIVNTSNLNGFTLYESSPLGYTVKHGEGVSSPQRFMRVRSKSLSSFPTG